MKQAIGGMIIGVPLFLWGFVQYRKSRAAAMWPTAQGAIVGATVESEFSRGGEDEADSWSYYPAVQYHYAVGQQTYQGNRIAIERRGYQRPEQAQAALAPFPVGQPVLVYYDPARPHEAVLDPSKKAGVVLMVIGALIAVVPLAAAL